MSKYSININTKTNNITLEASTKTQFLTNAEEKFLWQVSIHDSGAEASLTYVFIGTNLEARMHLLKKIRATARGRDDIDEDWKCPKEPKDIVGFAYDPIGSISGILYGYITCDDSHIDFTATRLCVEDIVIAK